MIRVFKSYHPKLEILDESWSAIVKKIKYTWKFLPNVPVYHVEARVREVVAVGNVANTSTLGHRQINITLPSRLNKLRVIPF